MKHIPQSRWKNKLGGTETQAFTLVEMLTVITVILILAAILLNVAGYANDRSARSRAQAEIAQFAVALEGYKSDNLVYPSVSILAGSPEATTSGTAPGGLGSREAGAALYQALTGDGNALLGGTVKSTGERGTKLLPNLGAQGKNYLPGLKRNQITYADKTDPKAPPPPPGGTAPGIRAWVFADPWSNRYVYSCPGSHNTGGYDLYSDAGRKPAETSWVKNW